MSGADLTPRELEVVQAFVDAEGSVKEAAAELGIGLSTTKTHLARARGKAGVRSNVALVIRVRKRLRKGPRKPPRL